VRVVSLQVDVQRLLALGGDGLESDDTLFEGVACARVDALITCSQTRSTQTSDCSWSMEILPTSKLRYANEPKIEQNRKRLSDLNQQREAVVVRAAMIESSNSLVARITALKS
jgi:hypothetical protein